MCDVRIATLTRPPTLLLVMQNMINRLGSIWESLLSINAPVVKNPVYVRGIILQGGPEISRTRALRIAGSR